MSKNCETCKHEGVHENKYPCVSCFRLVYDVTDKWEPKEKEQ